jgi:hypothetical protein
VIHRARDKEGGSIGKMSNQVTDQRHIQMEVARLSFNSCHLLSANSAHESSYCTKSTNSQCSEGGETVRTRTVIGIMTCLALAELLIVAGFVVATPVLFLFGMQSGIFYQGYHRHVERLFSNEDEEVALRAAESLYLEHVVNQSRWKDGGTGFWANYFDNETIPGADRFAQEHKQRAYISLSYVARVLSIQNFRLEIAGFGNWTFLRSVDVTSSWKNDSLGIWSYNDPYQSWIIVVYNSTSQAYEQLWPPVYWLLEKPGYLVFLELYFSDMSGPLAATYTWLTQFVVVDSQFEPVLVIVKPLVHAYS